MKRILIIFGILFLIISLSAASVGVGEFTENKVVYTPPAFINYSLIPTVNSSDFWDAYNIPADIPNSEFWYNHTLSTFNLWNATWDESGWVIANYVPYTGATANVDLGNFNFTTTGNVSATYFFGDGSQLTGISGGNLSWNESMANDLYCNEGDNCAIDWTNAGNTFKTSSTGQFTGTLGVGTAPLPNQIIAATKTIADNVVTGVFGGVINNLNTDSNQRVFGLSYNTQAIPALQSNNVNFGEIGGCKVITTMRPAFGFNPYDVTADDMFGYKSTVIISHGSIGSSTATNVRHFWATNPSLSSGESITTLYAFYDEGMTRGDTNWGFYGLSAQNYLAGKLFIDDDLNVTGNIINDAVYIQASDLVDQVFGATNTKQAINLTTTDENNSISISISNVSVPIAGVYSIFAQPQVTASAGQSGVFHMWLEKHDTSDWVNVSNSNVELSLSSQEEDVIPLIVTIKLNANEKVRVMGSVSNTGITLDAQTPAGEPVIPSIIFTMYKLGS